MAKAATTSTTNPDHRRGNTLHLASRSTPMSVEYTENNLVEVTLKTESGDLIRHKMSATALLNLVNLATATIRKRLGQFIEEVSGSAR